MVWTSDYPEGRPGPGDAKATNKSGNSSGTATGKNASGGSANSGSMGNSGRSGYSSDADASVKQAAGALVAAKDSSRHSSGPGSKSGPNSKSGYDPHSRTSPSPISGFKQKPKGGQKPPGKPGIFLLFGGVILPVAALAVELTTHMCAKSFFDPLPTPAHALLFALIPLSNFLVWMAARRNMTDMLGMLTLGTGMAMGVAILYSLMFLPLVPLSIVAILWFGFGLLALSPLLAIPAVWKAGKYAIHLSHSNKTYFDGHQLEHIGHLIILCTVVAVELPSTLTRMHIGEAAHSREPVKAIEWLRSFGNQEVMLRACYERSGRATDILGSLYEVKNPTKVDEAREIFYRVTGKPFNSVPLPASLRATRSNQGLLSDNENEEPNVEDEFDQDPDIAGETVSGVARGLTMNESKLAGFVDSNSCVADLMWNVTFGNTSKYDREVRSKILLPPGAVITNAFLIVNGKEREAKVMGRSMARSRYRAAVADKKDPLLVSTCGADRVLLQLYPVAPESKIGVRLNIISPLAVTAMDKVDLALPTFEERNFQVDIPTAINVKSDKPLSSTAKQLAASVGQVNCSIDGSLTTPELARFGAIVSVQRDPKITEVFGREFATSVGETIKKKTYPKPNRLTVVIDGSNGMSPHFASVLKELRQLPADMPLKLVYVRDDIMTNGTPMVAETAVARDALLKKIAEVPCAGGQINLPFVSSEVANAINNPNSAVLWLHAAQPISGKLNKRLELTFRKLKKPLLYDFAVAAGPNEVLSGLYACPGLVRVDRGGDVQSDLHRLFETWQNSTANADIGGIEYFRKNTTSNEMPKADTALARLVAFDEISKIQTVHSGHKCKYARAAVNRASQYHLVTAFSSAIISEPVEETRTRIHNKRRTAGFKLRNPERRLGDLGPSEMVDLRKFSPMMMAQRSEGITLRAKKSAELDSTSPRQSTEYQVLQGATNGTVGPPVNESAANTGTKSNPFASGGPVAGDQFASASVETSASAPFVNNIPSSSPAPGTPPVTMAQKPGFSRDEGASLQGKDLSFFESGSKSLRSNRVEIGDFAAAKEEVSERKQIAFKNDRDNADAFSDDEGGDDEVVGSPSVNTPAYESGDVASPVVPESDTYLLFGVGMLVLGFALRSNRKVRVKKA